MFDFEFPESMGGGIDHPYMISYGPFVVERNDELTLGIEMMVDGDDVIYSDGANAVRIDETFTTTTDGETVTAVSEDYRAQWVFRPVTEADAEWIVPFLGVDPAEVGNGLDALEDTITETLSDGGY